MIEFVNFCKKNYFLIVFAAFCVFISYSAKIFLFSIGVDTDCFIADRQGTIEHLFAINRTSFVFLRNLWHIKQFNPFYFTIVGMIFLTLSAVSWAYFISCFDKKSSRKLPLFAFVGVMLTSPIWAEKLYFTATENFAIIFILPFVIVALFKGFEEKSKKKIIATILIMAFIINVYQSFAVLFLFGIAIVFIFTSQNNDFDKKLPLKIFASFLISLAIYWLIGKFSIFIFQIDKSDYLSQMNVWNAGSIKTNILNILGFGYILTFAKIPQIHSIVSSVFLDKSSFTITTGMSIPDRIYELASVFGSVILLPLIIVFFVYLWKNKEKNQKVIYWSAGIFIPLSIMLLAIILGNKPPFRTLFEYPFVFGFLFYFIISRSSKKISCFFAILAFAVALNSSQISSALFYSDSERFRQDVFLAQQIDFEIRKIENEAEKINIAFIGKREPQKSAVYIRGEVIGFSKFEFGVNDFWESSKRGVMFMQSLGMNYELSDSSQMKTARELAKTMPNFPQDGSIMLFDDFIIVKLSDSVYEE